MATLRETGQRYPGQIDFPGQLLLTVAIVGALAALIMTQADLDPGPDAKDGLFAREAREGRNEPVWSLVFSPDGTRLASATITGEVSVKDLTTGRSHPLQSGPMASARSVAFSPDGRILAVAGGSPGVRLWDQESDKELAPIEVAGDLTTWVAFASVGDRLAVGQAENESGQGLITLWDWVHRRRLGVLNGLHGRVTALAFSPEGARLAAAGSVGLVTIWDMAEGRGPTILRVPESGAGSVRALAFSPDGGVLATVGVLERHVRLWDAAHGRLKGTIQSAPSGVNALVYSPDGVMLAMANVDGTFTLRDVAKDGELRVVQAQNRPLHSLAFSKDSRSLATGGADGAVCLWDVARE